MGNDDLDHGVLDRCCGVALYCGNPTTVLIGERHDGQGWCLPGGKLDPCETFEIAAIRETFEECGAIPLKLFRLGTVEATVLIRGKERVVRPTIFACPRWGGDLTSTAELRTIRWVPIQQALAMKDLFPPTREALKLFIETNGKGEERYPLPLPKACLQSK